ncbi:MAG: DUF86 domain-containing protein [Defluviitaleaceae bacterium]|nr:DUF86 domain-containing protein [Defluviitaleaceae bacterium]
MYVKGWGFLAHMIRDCKIIIQLTQAKTFKQFDKDEGLNRAVIYALLNLGELMKTFSETDKNEIVSIPWKDIIRFRNRAAHGYHNVSLYVTWNMATKQIPPLLVEREQKSAEQAEIAEKAELAEQAELAELAELTETANLAEQSQNPKIPKKEKPNTNF